jgi:membrane-associated phospholipid phosphatase
MTTKSQRFYSDTLSEDEQNTPPQRYRRVQFLTDFADQAVILPLAAAVALALLAQGWRRGAWVWVLAVVATFGIMLVLKLVFRACSDSFGLPLLHTPSGHTAAAAVVAGGLASLLLRHRGAALPLAVAIAALIGVSRLVLGAHTLPEVLVGCLVGLAGAAALLRFAGPPPAGFRARRIAVVVALVLLVLHGLHMPAEAHIRDGAAFLSRYFGVCVEKPWRAASSAATSRKMSSRVVSPLVTQARITLCPPKLATEIQATPEASTRPTMVFTSAAPSGGSRHSTARAESFANRQPRACSAAASSPASATAFSTCVAYPCQPAAASDRNSRKPSSRRDHCTEVTYGSTFSTLDGM